MDKTQRERVFEILSRAYRCSHCQNLLDATELFPLSSQKVPPFPEEYKTTWSRYHLYLERPFYLFCADCIRLYGGCPNIDMIKMGATKK